MLEQEEHFKKPISVFCSYAPEDEELYKKLDVHLSLQKREGLISLYSHQHVLAGDDKGKVTNDAMQQALLILLFISPYFIDSDDCYSIEMHHALQRHQSGFAQVIPILVRPTADREKAPFAHLQYLPRTGIPITTSSDQDSVFVSIVEEIRVIVEAQLAKIANEQRSSSVDKESRKQLLDHIYSTWITNVLEKTLHHASPVSLDMEEKPQLVLNPLQEIIPDVFSFHPVSTTSKEIMQLYDEANGAVLLLGDSGVGKTTLLLEIAKNVLERAKENEKHPIPIVLSLSSWKNRSTLFEKVFSLQREQGSSMFKHWLLYSLQEEYQLSRQNASSLIEADQLLLLLDGLDEIHQDDRHSCIQAINKYRQEHITVPIVICSKHSSYVNQGEYLYLQKAFVLRPLTSEKIDDYLHQMGEAGQAVSELLQKDPVLQELVTSPLMLTILVAVSREHVALNLAEKVSKEAKRKQIFETYTRCLFRQASNSQQYSLHEMTRLLSWLARGMVQHHQDSFSHLQVDWLSSKRSKQLYTFINLTQILILSTVFFICMVKLLYATSFLISKTGNTSAFSFGLSTPIFGEGFLVLAFVSLLIGVLLRVMQFGSERRIEVSNQAITSFVICGLLGLISLPASTNKTFVFGSIISCLFLLGFIGLIVSGMRYITSGADPNKVAVSKTTLIYSLPCIVLGGFFALVAFWPIFIFVVINIIVLAALGIAEYFLYKWLQGYRKTSQFIVKLVLFWDKVLPWNYEDFLNYAVEKGFLYKVGKGYSFAHTLLLNYFAELTDPLGD